MVEEGLDQRGGLGLPEALRLIEREQYIAGQVIRAERARLGLSQVEAGARSSTSQNAASRVEGGLGSVSQLLIYASGVGVSAEVIAARILKACQLRDSLRAHLPSSLSAGAEAALRSLVAEVCAAESPGG